MNTEQKAVTALQKAQYDILNVSPKIFSALPAHRRMELLAASGYCAKCEHIKCVCCEDCPPDPCNCIEHEYFCPECRGVRESGCIHYSVCCGAPVMECSDFCSDCKEHTGHDNT